MTGLRCVLALSAATAVLAADGNLRLENLSGRPDMVSGGDTLVSISATQPVLATLNGQDVSSEFQPGAQPGKLVAHLTGLRAGKNQLEVKAAGATARLELVNYPISGPVFSGPHQKPFVCQTEQAGLGAPLDADCSAKTVVTYAYKSTDPLPEGRPGAQTNPALPPAGFKPFDPAGTRPADLAKIQARDGSMVDYIVRRERGTINRAIYEIATVEEPSVNPSFSKAPAGWNGRLVYSFGGGCAAGYRQGLPGPAVNDEFLGQGYAVAVASLNVYGNNCNDVIAAETMMMVKEHFAKEFGPPAHTIGFGGSGGAIQQYMIAQNYPGLLDGLIPQISFPDQSIFEDVIDCSLLAHAFDSTKEKWSEEQMALVSGFATFKTCSAGWMSNGTATSLANNQIKATACNPTIPKNLAFDAANKNGARCDYFDNNVNLYGVNPQTGLARRALDNVGVQYGLVAFNAGKITAEQFLQLNEVVGGHDLDGELAPARDAADPLALQSAYQGGRVNSGGGSLGSIPILDVRTYLDESGNLHDRFRSMVIRARLKRANGGADNMVALMFPPSGKPPLRAGELVALMNQWLDKVAADTGAGSAAEKVAHDKPAGLVDACWTAAGEKIEEIQTYDGKGRCNQLYPAHADSRIASGAPLTDDVLKCALKPVDASDYPQALSGDQLARLRALFPAGVCDYSKPGIGQQQLAGTWRRY